MRYRRLWDFAVIALGVAILTILLVLRQNAQGRLISFPSTYDYGGRGYAALYRFLQREGLRTGRYELPLSELAAQRGTIVVAGGSGVAVDSGRLKAYADWVRGGGTLVVLGAADAYVAKALNLPKSLPLHVGRAATACGLAGAYTVAAPFEDGLPAGCSRRRVSLLRARGRALVTAFTWGKGRIVYSTTERIFDNGDLAAAENARFAYALFSPLGPLQFDETLYGHETGHGFWQVLPVGVRAAIVLVCIALLLAVLGENLPFAPPHITRSMGERSSAEYIASLARMLERGAAEHEVASDLLARARHMLAPRAASDPRAKELLERAKSASGLLAAGELFCIVRKEYGW